jgi:hypothetical protein
MKKKKLFIFRRRQAGFLLENVVVGFALAVVSIRVYLLISPMPILLVNGIHVAHMLYGGILLFIANIMTLLYKDDLTAWVASWLLGIGMGFFVDEIGKFISLDNDYYFQFALPLIYLVFLGLVTALILVRKRQKLTPLERVQQAWSSLHEGLAGSISELDFKNLDQEIKRITKKEDSKYSPFLKPMKKLEKMVEKNVVDNSGWSYLVNRDKAKIFARKLVAVTLIRVLITFLVIGRLFRIGYLILGALTTTDLFNIPFSFFAETIALTGFLGGLWLMVFRKHKGFKLAKAMLLFSIIFLGVLNLYNDQFEAILIVGLDIILYTMLNEIYKITK